MCLDLEGYGWSDALAGTDDHATYAKRTLGREIVDVMERIGHVRFSLVGDGRGARVGYRLALDQPGRVEPLALLDIVPASVQWERIAAKPGMDPHWTFLAKPAPEPEREIGRAPNSYHEGLLRDWTATHDLSAFAPAARELYW